MLPILAVAILSAFFIPPAFAGGIASIPILVQPVPVTFDEPFELDHSQQQVDSGPVQTSGTASSVTSSVESEATSIVITPIPSSANSTSIQSNPDSEGGLLARRQLYFEFDSYKLSEKYNAIAISHAHFLAKSKTGRIKLIGNCDERGSREYNIALGLRRAEGVKRVMVNNGAPTNKIDTLSYGSEKPTSQGHSEDAWAMNRRVDILYGDEE
jgi:peptidoglycan-associated lipoprotein